MGDVGKNRQVDGGAVVDGGGDGLVVTVDGPGLGSIGLVAP
jgi:hypothetical protein